MHSTNLRSTLLAVITFLIVPQHTLCQGAWTLLTPMPTPREFPAVATGPDGKVYVLGGYYAPVSNALQTMEAFDPGSGTWSTAAPMPTGRWGLSAATGSDGKIYAIGGFDGSLNLDTAEVYDPGLNSWASLPPMPTPRRLHSVVTGSDGLIYVIGGYGGVDTGAYDGNELDVVEAFDPIARTWSEKTPLLAPREAMAAVVSTDGTIYVIGGFREDVLTASVEAYSPYSHMWGTVSNMNVARAELAGAMGRDGRIYVFGGGGGTGGTGFLTSGESYEPSADTWTTIAPMSVGRRAHGASCGLDGTIYSIGGAVENGGDTSSVEAYTPSAPTYTINPLFDQSKAHKKGGTAPIKLQVLNGAGANVSSASLTVHAVSVTRVSGAAPGPLDDSGAANPDFDFRFDAALGETGGYIFNLSLKGYSTGTYDLNFTIGSDPTLRSVQFQVK